MNAIDREILDRRLNDARSRIYKQAEDTLIEVQEMAYMAGLERGQGNINKVIAVFEQMTTAIDKWMTGDLTGFDAINAITDAYDEMDKLNQELQQ